MNQVAISTIVDTAIMSIFRKVIIGDTSNWLTQFFRYIIVGGVAFVIDYVLLFSLTEFLHFHYLISASISFIAGLVVNYVISTHWIFKNSKLENKYIEFFIYSIIGIIGLLLNNVVLYFLTDQMGLHYMLSKLLTAVIVLIWNFLGRKLILFRSN